MSEVIKAKITIDVEGSIPYHEVQEYEMRVNYKGETLFEHLTSLQSECYNHAIKLHHLTCSIAVAFLKTKGVVVPHERVMREDVRSLLKNIIDFIETVPQQEIKSSIQEQLKNLRDGTSCVLGDYPFIRLAMTKEPSEQPNHSPIVTGKPFL